MRTVPFSSVVVRYQMSRTILNLDNALVAKAKKLTRLTKKVELVNLALSELIRQRARLRILVIVTTAIALFVMGTCTAVTGNSEVDTKKPQVAGQWSEPVNGLRGRLLVALENLHPGLRYSVVLELDNVSTQPVSITNQPNIIAQLFDSAKTEVTTAGFPMSGPIPFAQTAVVPRDAYVGFRIDMPTVGVPTKGEALLAVGGRTWGLKQGDYILKAALMGEKSDQVSDGQWVGQLNLLAVEIHVSEESVAGD